MKIGRTCQQGRRGKGGEGGGKAGREGERPGETGFFAEQPALGCDGTETSTAGSVHQDLASRALLYRE